MDLRIKLKYLFPEHSVFSKIDSISEIQEYEKHPKSFSE